MPRPLSLSLSLFLVLNAVCISMGAHQSMLREKGLQTIDKISINKVYDRYFIRKEIEQFEEFHIAFIDLCKDLTSLLLGTHYTIPTIDEIEEFYNEWNDLKEEEEKKIRFCDFMKKNVVHYTDHSLTLVTGIVAPAAAVIVKKTWKNTPLLNIIPLHFIPTFLFVPSFTLLSLTGIKVMRLSNGGT